MKTLLIIIIVLQTGILAFIWWLYFVIKKNWDVDVLKIVHVRVKNKLGEADE